MPDPASRDRQWGEKRGGKVLLVLGRSDADDCRIVSALPALSTRWRDTGKSLDYPVRNRTRAANRLGRWVAPTSARITEWKKHSNVHIALW